MRTFAALLLYSLSATAQTPVILISIDTLRADHLGAYGYRIRTPGIDSFAAGGTVFEQIDSQIPLTLPSHTALFTSTYPFQNRIEENAQTVPSGSVTLAATLKSHGYRTAAFVGSVLLDQHTGVGQGFDFYDSPFSLATAASMNPYAVRVRRDASLVLRAARQWLGENRGQPVFAFLHFFDLHTPYARAASGPGGLPATAGYDTEIQYLDQLLAQFRQSLLQSGLWDRALIVVLSDHGESLGDHGESSHGYFVYQSTLHVPLIVHWPASGANLPARAAQPGGLIDVAPTILDFLKLPIPPSFAGQSLLPSHLHPVYSESVYARDAFRWAALRSLRDAATQYIDGPKPELYDLSSDPAESRNLFANDAPTAARLRSTLAALLGRYAPAKSTAAPAASALSGVLNSLGYVTGASSTSAANAPDPKDKLPEYLLYEKALSEQYDGNFEAAIATFRKVVAQDPHNTLARYSLGDSYLRARHPDEAIHEWTATLQFDPEYAPADEAIGAVWMAREQWAKARPYFLQALAVAPQDGTALLQLGIAEARLSMWQQSVDHLTAACNLFPDSTQCQQELSNAKKAGH